MKVRRPRGVALLFRCRKQVDLGSLVRGEMVVGVEERPVVASPLDGREHDLGVHELAAFVQVPSDRWLSVGEEDDVLRDLAARGVLLSDREDEGSAELRRREDLLASRAWNPYAALYHYMARSEPRSDELREHVDLDSGRFVGLPPDDPFGFGRKIALHGPPPPAFHERSDAEAPQPLPRSPERHPLFDLLARRRTVRRFDRSASLGLDRLATLLWQVFGCQEAWEAHPGLTLVRRTSPSGGALHPVEVYPLVRRVDGLAPGLHHYEPGRHALRRLRSLGDAEVAEMAERFTAGQAYFATAPVLFVLTARFYRSFWKYRKHEKAYRVVCMDAGHLSQTLYLTATALDLGAFVTAALDDRAIERELGLDPFEEGALAVAGCGVPAADGRDPDGSGDPSADLGPWI